MSSKTKYVFHSGIAILGIGLTGLLAMLWLLWLQTAADTAPLPGTGFFSGLFLTLFFCGLGYYLYQLHRGLPVFQAEELPALSLVLGVAALFALLLPDILHSVAFFPVDAAIAGFSLHALGLVMAAIFLITTMLLAARLLLLRGKRWGQKLWQGWIAVLIISNLFHFGAPDVWPNLARYSFIGLGAVVALPLLTRMQWIALLSQQGRWRTLGILVVLAALCVAVSFKLWQMPLGPMLGMHPQGNMFLLLLGGFVNGFCVLSLLGLLFHLPMSVVLEERQHALEAFRLMQQETHANAGADSMAAFLLGEALRQGRAEAGWISRVVRNRPGDITLVHEGIGEADMKRIEYTLYSHPDHYQLHLPHRFIYLRDLQEDRFLRHHALDIRSLVFFPIHLPKGGLLRLFLVQKEEEGFDRFTIDLLCSYMSQAQLGLANLEMVEATVATERLKKDLEIGKRVQQRLLPASFPLNARMEMAASSVAAEEVGGDYYDYYEHSPHKMALLMSDVSGKGTTAAFHVAEMKGIFQALIQSTPEPKEFLSRANMAVASCFDKGMFITLMFAVVDLKAYTVTYARAGHCPMLHYRSVSRDVAELQDEGMGLGIVRSKKFDSLIEENTLELKRGDALIMYTDGISEARNRQTQKEYGMARLRDCILLNIDLQAERIVQKVVQDVQQFTQQEQNRDDMSLMILKIK